MDMPRNALAGLLGGLALALGHAAAGAALEAVVKDQHGKPVADAVVLAVPVDPKAAAHARPAADAVDQVDKQFVPYVKVVLVGSSVRFPNSDKIRHQVYSFSPAKRFELPLYAGTEAPPVLFDTTGIVVLGCNIHDWMVGYVYVAETPFFATTGRAGTASIGDLPPGDYTVRLWHPGMAQPEAATAKHVVVGADAPAPLEWQLEIKPTYRVPRVSGSGSPGYP
jgi:plastocyanin